VSYAGLPASFECLLILASNITIMKRRPQLVGHNNESLDPGSTPAKIVPEAPVHFLGLQGACVVIVDDQETARIALGEMIRGVDPEITTVLSAEPTKRLSGWASMNPTSSLQITACSR